MRQDELNNRTEIIDLKAGVLFVQTEKGAYRIYCPDKTVIYGRDCFQLACSIFNERVIHELFRHCDMQGFWDDRLSDDRDRCFADNGVGNETRLIYIKGDFTFLKNGDDYYVVDRRQEIFVGSSDRDKILEIMKKGVIENENEIRLSSVKKQEEMKDEFGNSLVMQPSREKLLFKVVDVCGNIFNSFKPNAMMSNYDMTRKTLSIIEHNEGTLAVPKAKNDEMDSERIHFKLVDDDYFRINIEKPAGRGKTEERLMSKKNFVEFLSYYLVDAQPLSLGSKLEYKRPQANLMKGEDAFEYRDQDEMGLYKHRKLSM